MKQVDKEKFKKMLEKVRFRFGLAYYGKSNQMRMTCVINDTAVDPTRMTDEQHLLMWQLLNSALGAQAKEMLKRDLLPDELKAAYGAAPKKEEKKPRKKKDDKENTDQ